MMRWALSVLLAGLAAGSAGAAPPGPSDRRDPRIDAVFAAMDRRDAPGCAVSVTRGGAIVHARGYGSANLEYGIPITPRSIFHVASVSKQFTATAVVLLALDGRLSLDDDVRKHVSEVPDLGRRITLRQLLHHTSGLRDQWDLLAMAGWRFEADVIKNDDVLDIVSRQRALNFEPGAEFLYSNTGYTMLGIVVERVSGKSLRDFTRERIFEPLGMRDTHFHDDHQMVVKGRAYAYAPAPGGAYRQSIPDYDTAGATSLFTTAEDLARWDRNFYTRKVGGDALFATLHQRGRLNDGREIPYAFGLVHGKYRGLRTVAHGGSDAGYRSHVLRFPDQRIGLAILCGFPSSSPGQLAEKVADIVLSDAFTRPAARPEGDPKPSLTDQVRSLAGFYVDPVTDQPIELAVRDGRLMWGQHALAPVADRKVRTASGVATLEILTGDGGRPRLRLTDQNGRDAVLMPAEPARPDVPLSEYLGTYHSDELGTDYGIEAGEQGLVLQHRKFGPVSLHPTVADGFRAANRALTFTRDRDGRVTGFTVSTGRVRKVRFDRTP